MDGKTKQNYDLLDEKIWNLKNHDNRKGFMFFMFGCLHNHINLLKHDSHEMETLL